MSRVGALRFLVLLAIGMFAGCTYGHQESQSGPYQPLVFPGEARLGATAFMVIDSNQIQTTDLLERYDLHLLNVEIFFVDDLGVEIPVNLRSVFPVETGRATGDAETRSNTWVSVALFDLPSEDDVYFVPPFPKHAVLRLRVDGSLVPDLEGVIWIVGTGGAPTDIGASPILPVLEEELQPQTMVRLRARDAGANGIEASWTIGAISAQIRYHEDCFTNPRVHTGSDAIGGGAFLGQPIDLGDGLRGVDVLLTQPKGFQLPAATVLDSTRLGAGPILDIVFDPVYGENCNSSTLEDDIQVHKLVVAKRDGTILLSRRDVHPDLSDSSEFLRLYYVDAVGR